MDERPSAPLLRMLREAADQRGLNTAALAKSAGVGRSELKQVLAGQTALTVDMFVSLAEVLELGMSDFSALASQSTPAPAKPQLTPIAHHEQPALPTADPLGNHASQTLRLGFALGCDMVLMMRTSGLKESNIPAGTLEQFPEMLPIRLEAAFHNHNDPQFHSDALTIQLSFDAIYTCT